MIALPIGQSGQSLQLSDSVLAHFHRHRQTRCYHREAGGQLFATLDQSNIVIAAATGPRMSDRRSRYSYIPDRMTEREEIIEHHNRGMFFIGDWHTHPERIPRPSPLDEASIRECFRESTHALNGFILIIVGTSELPEGLHVSIHDSRDSFVLHSYSPALKQMQFAKR